MADHGDGGGEGEVVDRPEDRGGPMGVDTGDQRPVEAVRVEGAVVAGHDEGNGDREQEVGGGDERRATEEEPRVIEETRAVEPSIEPVGSGTAAEGSPAVGGSSGGGGGAIGDDPELTGSPPRDPARGKGLLSRGKRPQRLLFLTGRKMCCSGQQRHHRATYRLQNTMSLSTCPTRHWRSFLRIIP